MPGPKAPPTFRPDKRPPVGQRRPAIPAVGGLAVPALEIPYSWLQPPLRTRPDKPYTTAAVGQSTGTTSGTTAFGDDEDSLTEYGDNPFTATLYTDCNADPANLATFMLDYYATQPGDVPRTRFVSLKICLSKRTPAEQFFLHQGLSLGRRISIYGHPATWPVGLSQQIVEGIHHVIGQLREVELTTSPVIGSSHGTPGPWFRYGVSVWGGSDVIPF